MASDIDLTNPATMAAPGGHYSHAVTANGFVFVAGQLPIGRDGRKLADAPFEQQAQQGGSAAGQQQLQDPFGGLGGSSAPITPTP